MLSSESYNDAIDSAILVRYLHEKSTDLVEGPDCDSKQEGMHRVGR